MLEVAAGNGLKGSRVTWAGCAELYWMTRAERRLRLCAVVRLITTRELRVPNGAGCREPRSAGDFRKSILGLLRRFPGMMSTAVCGRVRGGDR